MPVRCGPTVGLMFKKKTFSKKGHVNTFSDLQNYAIHAGSTLMHIHKNSYEKTSSELFTASGCTKRKRKTNVESIYFGPVVTGVKSLFYLLKARNRKV